MFDGVKNKMYAGAVALTLAATSAPAYALRTDQSNSPKPDETYTQQVEPAYPTELDVGRTFRNPSITALDGQDAQQPAVRKKKDNTIWYILGAALLGWGISQWTKGSGGGPPPVVNPPGPHPELTQDNAYNQWVRDATRIDPRTGCIVLYRVEF